MMGRTRRGRSVSYHQFPPGSAYWILVKKRALELHSNGCTDALDVYVEVCWEHDIHYRMHHTIQGDEIMRGEADARLRAGIRDRSPFGLLSPSALWRWIAVRSFGAHAWSCDVCGTSLVKRSHT